MAHTVRRTPAGQADALACWSAVLLLRVDPAACLADTELASHLAGLLSTVSQELEADCESVPRPVRCAAVELAGHIARRSSIPDPGRPGDADEQAKRPLAGPDHPTDIPFSRSIRLGRMG
jgi:hypothetical protein